MENIIAKIFVFATILIIGLFGFVDLAEAQTVIENPLEYESITEIIDRIFEYLWYLAWVFAPLMILIGVYYIISGGGNPARVDKGKKIIIYAVVGFLLLSSVRAILAFINSLLGVT